MAEKFSTNGDRRKKGREVEEILGSTLESFYKGDLTLVEDINEKELPNNQLSLSFSFKGGGKNILDKIKGIYNQVISKEDIKDLGYDFGIFLDGDKNCFVVNFNIDKNNPNYQSLKQIAERILSEIKKELFKPQS